MFVSRKKYDNAVMEAAASVLVAKQYAKECRKLKLEKLALIEMIVEHLQRQSSPEQFSQDEIRSLLMLVHPDKHDGKESAKVMTQKLLRMRK